MSQSTLICVDASALALVTKIRHGAALLIPGVASLANTTMLKTGAILMAAPERGIRLEIGLGIGLGLDILRHYAEIRRQ